MPSINGFWGNGCYPMFLADVYNIVVLLKKKREKLEAARVCDNRKLNKLLCIYRTKYNKTIKILS